MEVLDYLISCFGYSLKLMKTTIRSTWLFSPEQHENRRKIHFKKKKERKCVVDFPGMS